jgi:L-threonylcarbamoyladenylate synthase
MDKQMGEAIKVFKNGGIVIFPTDTAIGIGCRIDNENTVKKLFKIRNRPENKPVLALVDSVEMAEKYLLPIPKRVKDELIESYWPGKLTIILQSRIDNVPNLVRGSKNTLGVRFPKNPILLELIKRVGVPIVAPSANFSGKKTPFNFEDLDQELVRQADYVLNKKISLEKNVSTVIDCTVMPWRVVREGAVKIQKIILLIDTADNKKNMAGLRINGKEYLKIENVSSNRTQAILPMINNLLEEHSLGPKDLSEIQINTGPGSYTGLRVGLAVANALSFALKIPINRQKIGKITLPIYS